jgi:hypothetical protein
MYKTLNKRAQIPGIMVVAMVTIIIIINIIIGTMRIRISSIDSEFMSFQGLLLVLIFFGK